MKWKRSEIGHLHQLEVWDCPIQVLAQLAEAARVDVTVENLAPVRAVGQWFEMYQSIHPTAPVQCHRIRNARFDAALRNEAFLSLMGFWDANGVYAVFTERSPIAFRASDLDAPARYKALENFGFILEFGLAGPASAGVSGIVSPRSELIDLAESLLRES
jgi:hypothetical protein